MKKLHPFNTGVDWAQKDKPRKRMQPQNWSSGNTPQEAPRDTKQLSRMEELELQAKKAKERLTVQVLGVGGARRQGTYTLPFKKGADLSHYLKLLGLVRVATKARVYDLTYPNLGRRRLNYVPQADSRIQIGSKDYSPWATMQRSNGRDAMAIAKAMGGGAKVVEAPLVGREAQQAPSASSRRPGKAMDDLDVDQF